MDDAELPEAHEEQTSVACEELALISDDFFKSLHSIAGPLPDIVVALGNLAEESTKDHAAAFESVRVAISEEHDAFVTGGALCHSRSALRSALAYGQAAVLLPRILLVALVSQLEFLQVALMRWILKVCPGILKKDNKRAITFLDLKRYSSLEEVEEVWIEQYVRSGRTGGPISEFKWFSEHLKNNIDALPEFQQYREINDRRNLFVHHNGIASPAFIKERQKNRMSTEGMLPGQTVPCDPAYFIASHECIFRFGLTLIQLTWRRFMKSEDASITSADKSICLVQTELLVNREWRLSVACGEIFRNRFTTGSSREIRNIAVINECSALKMLGRHDEMHRVLETLPVEHDLMSAHAFALTYLRGDRAKSLQLMKETCDGTENIKGMGLMLSLFPAVLEDVAGDIEFQKRYKEITGGDLVDTFPHIKLEKRPGDDAAAVSEAVDAINQLGK